MSVAVETVYIAIFGVLVLVLFFKHGKILKGLFSVVINKIHGSYRSWPLFHAIGRLLTDRKCPKGLPLLNPFEEVSSRCIRVLGLNPGSHTLQGTNTWLIGTGEERLLVDTGEDITADEYVAFLLDIVLSSVGCKRISTILLTHGHGDHQGGVVKLLRAFESRGVTPLPKIYKRNISPGNFPARGFECINIDDGQVFTTQNDSGTTDATVQAVYTPGHTDDHVAFLLIEDSALISGDCILGCGTTVFDCLYEYMNSLSRLKSLMIPTEFQNNSCLACNSKSLKVPISNIYPGHGPVIYKDALVKVQEYIGHRTLRETQVLKALRNNPQWTTSWDLVSVVYPPLPLFVRVSAQWNVSHHLEKLLHEKKVLTAFPDLWKIAADAD